MHKGMPRDTIQGQGQGHECLKTTQEESTVSPARDEIFENMASFGEATGKFFCSEVYTTSRLQFQTRYCIKYKSHS